MTKIEKVTFVAGITISFSCGLISMVCKDWVLAANQIALGWFMFIYTKERTDK